MQRLNPRVKVIFYVQMFWILFFILVWIGGMFLAWSQTWIAPVLTLLAIFLLPYVYATLAYQNWGYELTPKALKIEKGIIWKKYISIPYDRIQNIDIYRGLLARILGLSDLQIQTAGYSVSYTQMSSEGRLPGLDPKTAEKLRDKLVDLVQKEIGQGL